MHKDSVDRLQPKLRPLIEQLEIDEAEAAQKKLAVGQHGERHRDVPQGVVVAAALGAEFGEALPHRLAQADADARAVRAVSRHDAHSAVELPAEVEQDTALPAKEHKVFFIEPDLLRAALCQEVGMLHRPLHTQNGLRQYKLLHHSGGIYNCSHVPSRPYGGHCRRF